jgi:hypothetical protein
MKVVVFCHASCGMMVKYTRREIWSGLSSFSITLLEWDIKRTDSIKHTYENNNYVKKKIAGCSRGGNDGTFVAAGHVGNGGDALLA